MQRNYWGDACHLVFCIHHQSVWIFDTGQTFGGRNSCENFDQMKGRFPPMEPEDK